MSDPRSRSRARRAAGAFTLIEIVLVVAILAALAGMVVFMSEGTDAQASHDLTRRTLAEVRRAIVQFKADTGHWPKRGPFNLHPSDVAAGDVTRAADGGRVRLARLPIAEVVTDDVRRAWFDAPANLYQLFVCPFPLDPADPDYHPLARWDLDRHRGWRGPYLTRAGQGWVAVRAGLSPDGTTEWPSAAPFAMLPSFPAVADLYRHESDDLGVGFVWTAWGETSRIDAGMGRPVVVLDLDPGDPGPAGDRHPSLGTDLQGERARVVSLGPDGTYSPVALDPATQVGPCVAGDDLGTYLLR